MSLRRRLLACAFATCLVFQAGPAGAITVEAPSDIAARVYDALKDGLQATDLTDAAAATFWSAVGDEIARTDICRQANAALSGPRGVDGPDASFNVSVTVTGGRTPVHYQQLMHVSTYMDFNAEIIVVTLVKADGTYGRKIECGRGAGTMPLPSLTEETRGGAQSFALQTEYGRIITYLPDDLRAGDTISGTVYVEPNGTDDATRRGNAAHLSGYAVEVAGVASPVSQGSFTFVLAASVGPFIPLTLSSGDTIVGAATLNAGPAIGQISNATIPAVMQADSPARITGTFDGNASNTSARLGDAPLEVLAESPRQVVVMCPPTPIGANIVHVNDGGRAYEGRTHNIRIALTAPRTTLVRGESTRVTLNVAGLQGLQAPIDVALWASQSVMLQGGNTQTVNIRPNSSNSAGEVERRYQLRVIVAGPFDVTATLVQP